MALMGAVALGSGAANAKPPDTWDGLDRIKTRRFDAVYLLPNADFSRYTKVMIDRPEVAFEKDWQRDFNSSSRGSTRVTDADIRRAIDNGSAMFVAALEKEYSAAGFPVTSIPGPDVLRVSTAILNIAVNAPDIMTAGRSRVYAQEAGRATLALEVRDSLSGTILGRAVDGAVVGDSAPYLRNSVSNRADFEDQFARWAKDSAKGLLALKSSQTPAPLSANAPR
jgi:hypothetical protein